MNVDECKLLHVPRIQDPRGNLSFIESDRHIPFQIKRVYYLYDVPGGSERGSHSHRNLQQFVVAVSGSFDVVLDDGRATSRFTLNRPYHGLYIRPMIWRSLDNFSSGAVCMVLASDVFDEGDYIRSYEEFVAAAEVERRIIG
jgi:hypothetical protein